MLSQPLQTTPQVESANVMAIRQGIEELYQGNACHQFSFSFSAQEREQLAQLVVDKFDRWDYFGRPDSANFFLEAVVHDIGKQPGAIAQPVARLLGEINSAFIAAVTKELSWISVRSMANTDDQSSLWPDKHECYRASLEELNAPMHGDRTRSPFALNWLVVPSDVTPEALIYCVGTGTPEIPIQPAHQDKWLAISIVPATREELEVMRGAIRQQASSDDICEL